MEFLKDALMLSRSFDTAENKIVLCVKVLVLSAQFVNSAKVEKVLFCSVFEDVGGVLVANVKLFMYFDYFDYFEFRKK